ncbi:MAG: histidine--tRNA ligase, partial [Muribaculaceae bacterium]|nr:histidine--tRNA ligase [Muribaculaceae bacterium]
VGIWFGADSIYDVLNQLNLYPSDVSQSVKVLFVNFGDKEAAAAARMIKSLREEGISAELYPDVAKMKKQMGFADSEQIPYVAIIGESELEEGNVTLKDMTSGVQEKLTPSELIGKLKND